MFISSPYKRAIDTIKPLAENRNSTIQLAYEFRERKISDGWIENILDECSGKTIVIGTHGTSLSTIINKYDNTFTNSEFEKIKNKMRKR